MILDLSALKSFFCCKKPAHSLVNFCYSFHRNNFHKKNKMDNNFFTMFFAKFFDFFSGRFLKIIALQPKKTRNPVFFRSLFDVYSYMHSKPLCVVCVRLHCICMFVG